MKPHIYYWSRYNHCFRSEKYGILLYNAVSNSFAEIPENLGVYFLSLKPGSPVELDEVGLYLQLVTLKCIVKEAEDKKTCDIIRMRRRLKDASEQALNLTIAPTRACNFSCIYCFEEERHPIHMGEETEQALLEFIRRYRAARALNVTWFGGEPLLRFEQIARLTQEFDKMKFEHYYANIITNGYLLTENVASRLNDLHIKEVQITIDGPEEIHNCRRKLVSGKGTYNRIMENIRRLRPCGYEGRILIRVNTDMTNADTYADVYKHLQDEFSGTKLDIYPGIVHEGGGDNSCIFNSDELVSFYINQYRNHGIETVNFYPTTKVSSCIAVCRNGYVVGPEGELYKCWGDIGKADKIVGSIVPGKPWNAGLLATWLEGQNALNDPDCLSCSVFPICNGGCPSSRIKNLYEGADNLHCTYLKEHLPDFLEVYYEKKHAASC